MVFNAHETTSLVDNASSSNKTINIPNEVLEYMTPSSFIPESMESCGTFDVKSHPKFIS